MNPPSPLWDLCSWYGWVMHRGCHGGISEQGGCEGRNVWLQLVAVADTPPQVTQKASVVYKQEVPRTWIICCFASFGIELESLIAANIIRGNPSCIYSCRGNVSSYRYFFFLDVPHLLDIAGKGSAMQKYFLCMFLEDTPTVVVICSISHIPKVTRKFVAPTQKEDSF